MEGVRARMNGHSASKCEFPVAGEIRVGRVRGIGRGVIVLVIRAYQALARPFLVGSCKFLPTCSEYAIEAVRAHGVVRGGWLAMKRLGKCHPFGPGGPDPVPTSTSSSR